MKYKIIAMGIALGGALLLSSSPIYAGGVSACVAGNLSSLIGSTCDIGNLQFTFTGFQSKNDSIDDAGNFLYNSPWSASNFTFTPGANGFSLTFLPGPQAISATTFGVAEDFAELLFNVVDVGGFVTGVNVTGGPLSASGANFSSLSRALYQGFVTNGDNQASWLTSVGDPCCGAPIAKFNGPTPFTCFGPCTPISSGGGIFEPFDLYAQEGGSASWDPSTGFTFSGTNIPTGGAATPEPGTLPLLASGLFGLAAFVRTKFGGA